MYSKNYNFSILAKKEIVESQIFYLSQISSERKIPA